MRGKRQAVVWMLMLLMLASCTPNTRQAWKDGRLSHDLARLRDAQWWPWTDKTVIPPPPGEPTEPEAPGETAVAPPPIPAPAPLLDVTALAPPVLAAAQPDPMPSFKATPRVKPPVKPVKQQVKPRGKPAPKPAAKPAAKPAPVVNAPPAVAPPASGFLNSQEVLAPLGAAKPAPDTAALPAMARLAPKDLIGLDAVAVERLLGTPRLNRHEPFAQVWQYSNAQCVLFVYLYAVKGGGQQVAHAETGARVAGTEPDPAACVTSFARKSQPG